MKYSIRHKSTQRGFIALISSVVISAILIGLMASVGMASFFARFDALGIENMRQAQALAESCVNVALLAFATSTDALHYTTHEQRVNVGADTQGNPTFCTIKDTAHVGSKVTISAYAESGNSFSSISATVSLFPGIQIISWNESP